MQPSRNQESSSRRRASACGPRIVALACLGVLGCGATERPAPPAGGTSAPATQSPSYGDDERFLAEHLPELIVLARGESRVAIAPEYQGRVMTSTTGAAGPSFGWINRALIASGRSTPHMSAYGGEDRLWLGPEGGQFGLYFPPGASFTFEDWQVPAAIDTEAWEVVDRGPHHARVSRRIALTNHSGAARVVDVEREVRLLDPSTLVPPLPDGIDAVAYESVNTIRNAGTAAWTPATGLVSIWILSMYTPSAETTVVIPFVVAARGPIVNAAYFGDVPPERLAVDSEAGAIFFRADGTERGKIGVPFPRARPVMGSWDARRGALTLVTYTLPDAAPHGYVNSMWEHQAEPYAGDVVNSYNDGPPAPGAAPLGPFYELESSSPAAALAPGESLEHVHRTEHLVGDRAALDAVARARLGVGVDAIEAALD